MVLEELCVSLIRCIKVHDGIAINGIKYPYILTLRNTLTNNGDDNKTGIAVIFTETQLGKHEADHASSSNAEVKIRRALS
jgi:hypothetical protein